jgi:putative endonuclease
LLNFGMMNAKQATGKWGELEAIRMIKEQGMEVIEANWSFLHLEIDVVARDGTTLVIAEVKTRSSNTFGDPETFVTPAKQKKLMRAANMYLQNKHLDCEVRFDVIGILQSPQGIFKTYVKDAFTPIA